MDILSRVQRFLYSYALHALQKETKPNDHEEEECLKQEIPNALNKRGIPSLLQHGVVRLPVDLTTTRVDVDLAELEPALAFPEVTTGPEEKHDRHGEVGFEEALGVVDAAAERPDSSVELRFGQ